MVGSFFLNFWDDFVPKGGRRSLGDRLYYLGVGTGLVLSTVKGWVEAHGGRSPYDKATRRKFGEVGVESGEGGGARFTLALPRNGG